MPDDPPPGSAAFASPGKRNRHGNRTLKRRAMRGSAWTFVGFGATQVVRLAGNVIVARMLAPEVFGIMAIPWVVLFALVMLSDVGSGPAIVRHERGEDPDFLNTAWTMQVIRGIVVALIAAVLAWPIALIYQEPILLQVIPVIALTSIIDGFCTMKMYTATRRLALGRQTMVELLSQMGGVVVMVVLAYLTGSIWALVIGSLFTRVVRMLLAQLLLPGLTNWFRWEREAAQQLFSFGRWILSSSILMLVGKQADKVVMPLLESMAVLGVYDRAGRLSDPFSSLNMQLARKVVFPALSSVHRDRPAAMSNAFYRARLVMDAAFLPILGALVVSAPIFVQVLYDERYEAGGWMLQMLIARVAMQCMVEPSRECLVALDKAQYALWLTLGRTLWIVVGLPIGWYFGGLPGFILAMALSEIPALAVVWFGMIRYNLFNIQREILAVLLIGAGALAGWGFTLVWAAVLSDYWLLFEAWLKLQWSGGGS